MKAFARLLENLAFTTQRTAKVEKLAQYLRAVPDPDRGYALGALTGALTLPTLKPSLLRNLAEAGVDPELFRASYDFVGDLAETIALIWPGRGPALNLRLSEVITTLAATPRAELAEVLTAWLDGLSASERFALVKLATGALRVGVSVRLAHVALAALGQRSAEEIAERWHAELPPYEALFAWIAGGEPLAFADPLRFRPLMLAHPLAEDALSALSPEDFVAEWKWDGIRVQAVGANGQMRLYSRSGEDITSAFPDLASALRFDGVIDGELLVWEGSDRPSARGDKPAPEAPFARDHRAQRRLAPFSALQKRLNRKTVSTRLMAELPALIRAYDLLEWRGEDLRPLPFVDRRARLEAAVSALGSERLDLSPLLPLTSWHALDLLRQNPPEAMIEGIMLKRRDAPYLAGRPKGWWWKWKRDPVRIDAVLMYAQRGHGKRSGFYSDFTFGLWHEGALVPVGKAYFGFTDDELRALDRFVRENTVERFGPVRAVAPKLVLEVAFEGVQRSARHRSGVALRFPRIARIRWDKPVAEADALTELLRHLR